MGDLMKVGTVFSGIGAIEHALLRMGLKHKIAFACDNGDVDIFAHKVAVDINSLDWELAELKKYIKENNRVLDADEMEAPSLREDIIRDRDLYADIHGRLNTLADKGEIVPVECLLNQILKQESVKTTRRREYAKFLSNLQKQKNSCAKMLESLQYSVEIVNDFKKDNDLGLLNQELLNVEALELQSKDGIDWKKVIKDLVIVYQHSERLEAKKIIKSVHDVSERIGMVHEKIQVEMVRSHLEGLATWEEKKKYIDNLYEPYENKNQVRKSYLANYELSPQAFHWNVSFLDGNQYTDDIDLFVGGSPCQSFSLVGKQRGLEDTRGTLFYEYARLVKEIRPKVFIYENVKAVLSNDEGRTWETMQQVFNDLGYNWKYQVLNAKNYGIPQNRERVFVVGFRNDLNLTEEFKFPDPVELTTTMKDFLLDNVSGKYYLPKKGVDFVTMRKNLEKRYTQIDGDVQLCQKKNQQFNWHGDFVFVEDNTDMDKTMEDLNKYFLSEKVYKYVMATGTKNFVSRPKTDLDVARPLLTTMHKMHRAGVDNYVHTEGRLRKLTPRECLRLMGFCDSFKICVSDTAMYQQAGNSIVVDVLIAIMGKVLQSYPALLGDYECG